MESYAFSIQLTLCMCLLLAYIVQTTRVYFDRNLNRNKMSLWPYYLVICYLVSRTICYGLKCYKQRMGEEVFWFQILYLIMTTFNCFLWSCVILVQCFEWSLITCLVKFQKEFDFTQLSVKRDMFRSEVEPKVVRNFWISMIVNAAYHISRVVIEIFYIVKNGTYALNLVNVISAAYYIWLLVYFSVCSFSIMY